MMDIIREEIDVAVDGGEDLCSILEVQGIRLFRNAKGTRSLDEISNSVQVAWGDIGTPERQHILGELNKLVESLFERLEVIISKEMNPGGISRGEGVKSMVERVKVL